LKEYNTALCEGKCLGFINFVVDADTYFIRVLYMQSDGLLFNKP